MATVGSEAAKLVRMTSAVVTFAGEAGQLL